MDSYQAREFSYFVDWLNYHAALKSAVLFGPNFQSSVHYLLSLAIVTMVFYSGGCSWTS